MKLDCLRTRRDQEQAARLVADSFAARHPALENIFRQDVTHTPGVDLEHVRVVRLGARIAALLVIYEKTVRLGRARMKMGGLGFVCCAEQYRGRGLTSACLRDSIQFMQSRGFHYSLLFGIDRFYTRVGYTGCLPGYKLRIPVRELDGTKSTLLARDGTAADLPSIVSIYHQSARDCLSSAERSTASLREGLTRRRLLPRQPRSENGIVVFHPKRNPGNIRGYLAWMDGHVREAGVSHDDPAAASAMLVWLREKRRAALEKEVILPHGTAHPLTQHALRSNHTLERSFSWTGGGMGRLIDATAFLDALQPELEVRLNRAGVDGQCHVHCSITTDENGTKSRATGRQAELSHTLRLGAGHHFMLNHRPQYWLKIACSAQSLLQLSLGSLPFSTLPDVAVEGERSLIPVLFPPSDPELFGLDHF